ncbi:sec-3, partial [Pristionchus pacificus]
YRMNAIRSSLQRQLFQDDEERLSAIVSLVKIDGKKKKRPSYLCLTLSAEHPICVRIYLVKEDKEDSYRKKEKFQLREVRAVDGLNPRKPMPDFSITLSDRTFRLTASSCEEKDTFIRQLYKMASKFFPFAMPDFMNVPIPVEEPVIIVPIARPEEEQAAIEEYQPISTKEEADFRRLLQVTELKLDQADLFVKALSNQLQSLDGANIESMMGSEKAVNQLLDVLDGAIDKVSELDVEMNRCDQILCVVRDSVELIEEKDSLSVVERKNKEKLEKEARHLVAHLDILSSKHLQVLSEANISDPASISRVVEAARAVSQFVAETPKTLRQMKAYQDQNSKLSVLDLFVDRLMSHLTALFNNLADMTEAQDWHSLSIPKQSQRHRALSPLADLMGWLKSTRDNVYRAAIDRYIDATRKLYQRLFDRFFDVICNEITKTAAGTSDRRSSSGSGEGMSANSLSTLIETVLGELNPVITNEQKFCLRFFHINSENAIGSDTLSMDSGDSGSIGARGVDKQVNEQVRLMMGPLFDSSLSSNLDRFTKACCKSNRSNILLLFVIMSKKVLSSTESGSYYAVTFGSLVVLIKRQFDMYMEMEAQNLREMKLTKKTRVGILPTMDKLALMIRLSEDRFKGSDRRTDLEKWYVTLVKATCEGIEKTASSPYSKSPPTVVRFENYHQLYQTLSEQKINCLDHYRKEAKRMTEENIEMYVREHMGRPLEKIHLFFDSVSRAKDRIRAEEIAYQQQFSKMELKKVISQYPGKEVRKGLEQLYKKLEKHLVDNSSLLQVVWRNMQEAFIKQMQSYQQIMAECYPNSKIELEVSIDDVLSYFSDIAQSH